MCCNACFCDFLLTLLYIYSNIMAPIHYSNKFMHNYNGCSWELEHHVINRYGDIQ